MDKAFFENPYYNAILEKPDFMLLEAAYAWKCLVCPDSKRHKREYAGEIKARWGTSDDIGETPSDVEEQVEILLKALNIDKLHLEKTEKNHVQYIPAPKKKTLVKDETKYKALIEETSDMDTVQRKTIKTQNYEIRKQNAFIKRVQIRITKRTNDEIKRNNAYLEKLQRDAKQGNEEEKEKAKQRLSEDYLYYWNTIVTRKDLIKYCESIGEKPVFLFPTKGKEEKKVLSIGNPGYELLNKPYKEKMLPLINSICKKLDNGQTPPITTQGKKVYQAKAERIVKEKVQKLNKILYAGDKTREVDASDNYDIITELRCKKKKDANYIAIKLLANKHDVGLKKIGTWITENKK